MKSKMISRIVLILTMIFILCIWTRVCLCVSVGVCLWVSVYVCVLIHVFVCGVCLVCMCVWLGVCKVYSVCTWWLSYIPLHVLYYGHQLGSYMCGEIRKHTEWAIGTTQNTKKTTKLWPGSFCEKQLQTSQKGSWILALCNCRKV